MKTNIIRFILAILLLQVFTVRNLFSQNIIQPNKTYKGSIYLKDGTIITSKNILYSNKILHYTSKSNSFGDSLQTNSIDFLRLDNGTYAVEGLGVGLLFGVILDLRVALNDSYKGTSPEFYPACIAVSGGIGLLIGLLTKNTSTYYPPNVTANLNFDTKSDLSVSTGRSNLKLNLTINY